MSKGRYLLQRDIQNEQDKLESQASKKSLFGSLGRTLGGFAAMALTGGAATPLVAGAMAAGGSFLGGAIGANQQKIGGGKFFKEARQDLSKDLGAFGAENITSSLKSGITAGATKASFLKTDAGQAAVEASKASGQQGIAKAVDFQGSYANKGVQLGKNLFDQFKSTTTLENPRQLKGMTGMNKFDYMNLIRNRQQQFAKDNPGFNSGDDW